MKLVLYGGGHGDENHSLDSRLMSLISKKKPLVTYIPSCSIYAETDFVEFAEQFQKFGVRRILNFPIDRGIDSLMMKAILQSDMIHLSGGNTYYFLKYLRQTGMLNELKKYVSSGGILTGLSAGAILMTPNIDTASFPSFDKDENEEKVKNFKSLKLVDFHFFPHYKNSNRYDIDLLKYSQKVKCATYAVPDGAGIIVNGNELIFHNKVYCFYQNKKMVMSSI